MGEKIQALGKVYDLVIKDDLRSTSGLIGSVVFVEQKIHLDSILAKDQFEETIVHEVVHIINNELKLDIDEVTTARLAVGLYSAGIIIPRIGVGKS